MESEKLWHKVLSQVHGHDWRACGEIRMSLRSHFWRQILAAAGFVVVCLGYWGAAPKYCHAVWSCPQLPQTQSKRGSGSTNSTGNALGPVWPSGRGVCLQFNCGNCSFSDKCQYDHVFLLFGSKEHTTRDHPSSLWTTKTASNSTTAMDPAQQAPVVGPHHFRPFLESGPFTCGFFRSNWFYQWQIDRTENWTAW